jgi:hypothetical protein
MCGVADLWLARVGTCLTPHVTCTVVHSNMQMQVVG